MDAHTDVRCFSYYSKPDRPLPVVAASSNPLRHLLAERSGVARAMIHKKERGESSRAAVQEAKLDEAVELTDTYCAIAGVAQRFTRLSQIFPRWVRLRPLTVAFALCRA